MNPSLLPARRLLLAAFLMAGFLAAASIGLLSAATTNAAPPDPAPAASTNSPGATHASTAKKPIFSITTDDGDDDDDKTPGKHKTSAQLEIDTDHGSGFDWEGLLIPLAGIAGTFGLPLGVVFFVFYFRHRRRLEKFALAREFLAKGMPVPPQLLDDSRYDPAETVAAAQGGLTLSQRDIRKGFKLAFIGLGISVALYISGPHSSTWGWGLIPAIMGLGFIISGTLQARQDKEKEKARGLNPPLPPTT